MSVNQIKGKFIKLSNDEALKASNAAGSGEVNIVKVDSSDNIVLLDLPIVDDGVNPASNVATESYVDSEVGAVSGDLSDHINDAVDAHDASAISFDNSTSGIVATTVQSALDDIEGRVDALEVGGGDTKQVKISANDTTEGYIEDKIVGASGKISISTLNDGLNEDLQIDIGADVFDKTIDGAADISFSAVGNIVATDVQSAIQELDDEKVAKAGDTMTGQLDMDHANIVLTFDDTPNNLAISTSLLADDLMMSVSHPDFTVNAEMYSGNVILDRVDITATSSDVSISISTDDGAPQFLMNKTDYANGYASSVDISNNSLAVSIQDTASGDLSNGSYGSSGMYITVVDGATGHYNNIQADETGVSVVYFNGSITAPIAPTTDYHLTNKKYVDDGLALKFDSANFSTEFDNNFALKDTDDLAEGTSNLYFTDTRAKDAAVDDAIVDGVTDVAPSQNAVFDALALKLDLAGGTMTGSINMNNLYTLTNLPDPSAAQDAANKRYVDAVAEGLHVHKPARLLANVDLGGTYNNGSSGVGAHIDFGSPIASIDGVTSFNVGDRIILAFQNGSSMDLENGIYFIEDAADIDGNGDITKLTRAQDFDTPTEMAGGDFVFVQEGSIYADSGWVMTETVISVGTTPVQFLQFSGAGTYSAGDALFLNGGEFDVLFDNSSIGINGSNELEVKLLGISNGMLQDDSVTNVKIINDAVDEFKIDAAALGDGLTGGSGSLISVNHDGEGLQFSGIQLSLELDGSTLTKSISGLKLSDTTVTASSYGTTAAKTASFTVDAQGRLTAASEQDIDIVSTQINDFGTAVRAEVSAGDGLDYDSGTGVFSVDANIAGDGLSYTTGILSINAGDGLSIVSDNLQVNVASGLAIVSDNVQIDLAVNSGLNVTSGLAIDSSLAGDGLSLSAGVLSINAGDGLEIDADNLRINLPASDSGLKIVADELTIEPADFAGHGLEDDGSDNLRIKSEFSVVPDISVSSSGLSLANRWYKEKYAVTTTLTSGAFYDLDFEIEPSSLMAHVDRLAIHEGASDDYSLSTVGGVTRVTFLNALVSAGQQQLGNGDTIFFMYQKKAK